MNNEIAYVDNCRSKLEISMKQLISSIGRVPIGKDGQIPYGWRKAAKGRTVWRLLEEIISQNLELHASDLGMQDFEPAPSEVGVYDFSFHYDETSRIYVNVKSALKGGRTNKDDISKAFQLNDFMSSVASCVLLVASVEIDFLENPLCIELSNCYVVPVSWLPDIYVNPSNNGNLQSSKYKNIEEAVPRTCKEFLEILRDEIGVAERKRAKRQK